MKLSLLILLFLSATAFADTVHTNQHGIAIDVTLEPTTFTVGDTVSLQIKAIAPDNMQLIVANTSFDAFFITNQSSMLDIPLPNGREWVWSYELDTFDASIEELSTVSIEWNDDSGNEGTIVIEPIPINVQSVVGENLNQLPLRDIVVRSETNSAVAYWILAIVVIIFSAAITATVLFIKQQNVPRISPQEKAQQAIKELRKTTLDADAFYTQLSDIVRTYLEERFQISATGYTTREFLISEKSNPRLEHSDRNSLAEFLVAADLVKYARFEPSKNNWDGAIKKALHFISSTTPTQQQTKVEVAA